MLFYSLSNLYFFTYIKGVRGIVQLGRNFRIIDDDGNGQLNVEEFRKGIQDSGIRLSNEEIKAIFKVSRVYEENIHNRQYS